MAPHFSTGQGTDMRKLLRNVAEIGVGHSFRSGIRDDARGEIRVLQIRDIRDSDNIDPANLPRVVWPASGQPPLLKHGDVVMPARGDRYAAALIRDHAPLLASGQLYVLHPKHADLMSEYLCWYLNQPESRSYILKNSAGTGIPILSRSVLGDLPIPVPSLETQRKIVALQQSWQQEQSLTRQLLANRQKMLDSLFAKLVLQ
jgi:hypothetical protein